MPKHPENIIGSVNVQAPAAFLQDCMDQCLSHARDITSLIQKALKVESDHLFRDPWFGLCIWDSTISLLASVQQAGVDASYKDSIAELLKLNLKALTLCKSKIPLTKKIVSWYLKPFEVRTHFDVVRTSVRQNPKIRLSTASRC